MSSRVLLVEDNPTDEKLSLRAFAKCAVPNEVAVAEEALRMSEARFARLAESGVIGIAVTDLSGTVYEANDAYLALVGYSRADLEAGLIAWTTMTPPKWHDTNATAVAAVLSSGVSAPWEKEIIRKDGSLVSVLVGAAMLDHPMCITFYVDLTERRRAEEALRHTEEQLLHAQKMEAIGSLAGGVAHDFNNLLSVILSYAWMLAQDVTPGDPLRAGLEEIRLAGERAAGLTSQLLAFSRRQMLHPQIVNLNDVVVSTENMLRRLIGEDIELIRVAAPHLPAIFVDPGQLEQVIMNLAVNARDAMRAGGKLTIETEYVVLTPEYANGHAGARTGPHVMLAVSDTGTGMDAETQTRIFEPFFTTKDVGEGTGLGLSTVFGIVKQSGGMIWVYSEVGSGTVFRIYFPIANEAVVPAPAAVANVATLDGSETILVVEDDDRVRTLACIILRRHGYNVLEAAGGGDALLICEQHPAAIHLLVTDVVMPRMSGKVLAERLQVLRPDLRVLFMSGYTASAVVRHGIVESTAAFVQKPFRPESLARAVRLLLDGDQKSPVE